MNNQQQAPNTGVINIRGKEYKTVALRVNEFYEQTENLSLTTQILMNNETLVLVRAEIADATGRVLASGHAEEFRGSNNINRTSAVENAETSAIGRCLATFGFGGSEFASANEVQHAIAQQNTKIAPEKLAAIVAWIEKGVIQPSMLFKRFGHDQPERLLDVEADRIINGVQQMLANEDGEEHA